jgi:hypothetical protein
MQANARESAETIRKFAADLRRGTLIKSLDQEPYVKSIELESRIS